jgi:hypothetical protein
VGKSCRKTRAVKHVFRVLKHARDTGHVSTVPVYCVPGSGLLSYVSRKLKVPRNQSVLYVQKSVRIPNTPLTDE